MANLDLTAGAIDIGALLRGLGVAEDIDGSVQTLQVNVVGRGSSLGEWVAHSEFDVRVSGGHLALRGAAQSTLAKVRVDGARIGARTGEPVRAWVEGEIDQTPVSIELESGTLADFASDASRMPFALAARAAGTQLSLDGEVSLPLGSGGQLSLCLDLVLIARIGMDNIPVLFHNGPFPSSQNNPDNPCQTQINKSKIEGYDNNNNEHHRSRRESFLSCGPDDLPQLLLYFLQEL